MNVPHVTQGVVGTEGAAPPAGPDAGRLGVVPGLDGLRALAVVLVLLFHNGFDWARGGFLGVSVFFTLSGYLITSLLLEERRGRGGIALVPFWRRRFRRLLPASLVCMVLVIAFGVFAADPTQRAELAGDITASLAYVANWWFLASGQSYAELFAAPSPLLHFWSLAIEEQFYLLLPLAAFALLGRRRHAVRNFTLVIAAITAVCVALPFVFALSDDWIYYATPTRAPELLTGVLLAVVVSNRDWRNRLTSATARSTTSVATTIIGIAALAATLTLAATTTTSSSWLYRGGLPAFSVVSIALIVGAHNPHSPLTRLLSTSPVRHLGHISYGVYLYHWPIFLWLDPARTSLDGWALFAVRMVVTLTLAELSYRFVEMPIRRTGRLPLPGSFFRLGRLAPVAIVVVVAGGVLTSLTAPPKAIDFDLASRSLADAGDGSSSPPPTTVTAAEDVDTVLASLPADPPTPRVAVFGDSTAMMTGFGLGAALTERPGGMDYTEGVALLGCGVNSGDPRLLGEDRIDPVPRRCRPWPAYWSERVRANAPNVAFVQVGPWDVMTRQVTPNGPFLRPGDPEWDEATLDEMLVAIDQLSADGAYTMWATAPLPNRNLNAAEHFAGSENVDPARFAHLNTLIAKLPGLRPGKVGVIDLAGWHAGRTDDETLRPDGVHLSGAASPIVGREFLIDEITRQFDLAWRSGDVPRLIAESVVANQRRPDPPRVIAGEPVRVAVWSDERTPDVVDQVTAGASAAGITIEVQTFGSATCGIARTGERRRENEVFPMDSACQDRFPVANRLATFNPHLVVVAPGAHEAAEHRPWTDWDQWRYPDDPFIAAWLLRDYASAADLAGRTGALVALAGLNPGEVDPYTASINDVVLEVSMAPDRASWLANIPASDAPAWAMGQLNQSAP